MKLLTADQAFNVAMNLHPSLYASDNIKKSKLKFFDHIFNVIGNGYRDLEEFKKGFTLNKSNKAYIDSYPSKYISSEPLYYAYTKVEDRGGFVMPDHNSSLTGLYTAGELHNMKEVVYKVRANGSHLRGLTPDIFIPYPNFSKNYSMIWRMDIDQLDKSWLVAAKYYYENAIKFFESSDSCYYHSAVPVDKIALDRLIKDYEKSFERLKKPDMSQSEFYEQISKNYELEYKGDTLDFIKRRWNIELERIKEFICESIELLDKKLENEVKVPVKCKIK